MKNIIYSLSLLACANASLFLSSCNRQEPKPEPAIVLADSLGNNNRAIDIRTLTTEEVFLRIPKSNLEVEGLEKLDEKARKALLEQGKWGGYQLTKNNNWIILTELPQNDDDASERTNTVQIAVFTQKESGEKQVLILKKQMVEDDKEAEELKSVQLWGFDGKSWDDASATLPRITTDLFFKPNFNLKGNTEDFIRWDISSTDPYEIKLALIYHLYPKANPKLSDRYLIDNESNTVSLFWNGENFNLVTQPFTESK